MESFPPPPEDLSAEDRKRRYLLRTTSTEINLDDKHISFPPQSVVLRLDDEERKTADGVGSLHCSSISSAASFALANAPRSLCSRFVNAVSPSCDSRASRQRTPCGVNRFVLLVIYVLYVFTTGCIYFGWPSLSIMLFMQDAYVWLCPDGAETAAHQPYKCSDQDTEVQRLFQIATPVHFVTSAMAGYLMDNMGPKATGAIGQGLNCIAWVLLSQASESTQTYIPAFIFIGLGADAAFLPTMTVSNLFPGNEGLVIAVMGAANSASYAMPVILLAIMEARGGKPAFEATCLLYAGVGTGMSFVVAMLLLPREPFVSEVHLCGRERLDSENERYDHGTATGDRAGDSCQEGTALDLTKLRASPDYRKRSSMSFRAMADLNLLFGKYAESSCCGQRHYAVVGRKRQDLWGYHCWHYDLHLGTSKVNREQPAVPASCKRRQTTAGLHLGSVQGEECCEMQRHRGVVSHELLNSDTNPQDSPSLDSRSLAMFRSCAGSSAASSLELTFTPGVEEEQGISNSVEMPVDNRAMHSFDDVVDFTMGEEQDLVMYSPVSFRMHVLSVDYIAILVYFMFTSVAFNFWTVSVAQFNGAAANKFYGLVSPFSFVVCLIYGKLVDFVGIFWILAGNSVVGILCYAFSLIDAPVFGYLSAVAMAIYVSFYTSQLYCYVEWRFDVLHFGKLVGIASASGGLFSLLAQPLYDPLSKRIFKGNFLLVGVIMLACLTINVLLVLLMWWMNRRHPLKYSPLRRIKE
eukprot:GHVS01010844.1.p1 GENE.GHVS01010844.1~~GHVS01010844.1.p1  ORF type:complete len:748 (-),score=105.48 GHVS01010844.1:184-2427(-)